MYVYIRLSYSKKKLNIIINYNKNILFDKSKKLSS